jgi:thiamine biosynthesis lipoprotein ApbE
MGSNHPSTTRSSIRRARPLLGTFVEIAVAGPTIDAMEVAVESAFSAIAAVHRLMSFHETDSDVGRLNREAAAGAVRVHDWTYQVLEAACDLRRRSDGVFDVSVAPALQRMGLLPDVPALSSPALGLSDGRVITREGERVKHLRPHPEERRIFAARLEGWQRVRAVHPSFETAAQEGGLLRMRSEFFHTLGSGRSSNPGDAAEHWIPAFAGMTPRDRHDRIQLLSENQVRFADHGVKIDLGGIAKGFAVDRAVEALRHHGVAEGLVNAGGDLRVFGPCNHVVDIRDPRQPDRPMCCVALCNAALASSAGRFDPLRSRNALSSGVVDPATSRPVQSITGATVCASSCMIADALTKVVMNSGEAAVPILEHDGADAMFVSARGDVHMTADWKNEVHLAA